MKSTKCKVATLAAWLTLCTLYFALFTFHSPATCAQPAQKLRTKNLKHLILAPAAAFASATTMGFPTLELVGRFTTASVMTTIRRNARGRARATISSRATFMPAEMFVPPM